MLQWNRAWRSISASEPLSLLDKARFFAMLTSTSSDALIACWDSKFFYSFWRPVTAIRAGDTDGNPDTEPDLNWIGLVNAPNHPEYPAAHGCFSSASAETLQFFFGTDRFDFIMDSKVAGLTNPVRHYTSFSQALQDALDARVYGECITETRLRWELSSENRSRTLLRGTSSGYREDLASND